MIQKFENFSQLNEANSKPKVSDIENLIGYCYFGEVCFVICEIEYEGLKSYIKPLLNNNSEYSDIKNTIDYGNSFPIKEAKSLIKQYGTILKPEIFNKIK